MTGELRPFDLWVSVAVNGPIIATSVRGQRTVHAFDADSALGALSQTMKRSRRTTIDAVCGAQARVHVEERDGQRFLDPWPPRLDSLADGVARCSDCHARYPRRKRRRA